MNAEKFGLLALTISFVGCATSPVSEVTKGRSGEELLALVCSQGGQSSQVSGSIWAKVESRELKGQFPATFRATRDGLLALEITDLIGTPQAWLKLEPGKTPQFKLSSANERRYGSQNIAYESSWAGLPFELAPSLFLGKMPCPSSNKDRTVLTGVTSEGRLQVRERDLKEQRTRVYLFSFTDFGGVPWADRLEYRIERGGAVSSQIQITFMGPTDPGPYPKRWKAQSDQGSIEVRWKDRAISP